MDVIAILDGHTEKYRDCHHPLCEAYRLRQPLDWFGPNAHAYRFRDQRALDLHESYVHLPVQVIQ